MSTAQFAGMTTEQALRFMPNAQRQPARARLAELVGGRDVIDIGCGKGEEVGELFTAEQYAGIDCSPELVAIAGRRWPGYRFVTCSAQEIRTRWVGFRWPFAIIKAVLEHLPPHEAVEVYDAARAVCDTLLVAWHTEPGPEPKLTSYQGELGVMVQNRHLRSSFGGMVQREVVSPHVIWIVT